MKYSMTKEEFEEICRRYELVGGNIIIYDKDEMVSYQYGYQDKEEEIETSIDTIYRIASISKTVLAIGAMKLVEEGLLDLDEDISTYLGFDVKNPNHPNCKITTRMLMTQTSSISDGFDDEELTNETRVDGYNGVNGRHLGLPLITLLVPNDTEYYTDLTFDKRLPGTHFEYSNFGCGILACIMEKVANQNFDEYMKKVVFDKLNIDGSYYAYNIKNQSKIASLYRAGGKITGKQFVGRAYKVAPIGESYLGPAGGLFISISNLSKIMRSFLKEEYRLLNEETIEKMMEINWIGDCEEYKKKALQMMVIDEIVPIRLWGHFGTAYGLRSMMLFNKELETGVCFITNGGNTSERCEHFPKVHYDIIKKIWGTK